MAGKVTAGEDDPLGLEVKLLTHSSKRLRFQTELSWYLLQQTMRQSEALVRAPRQRTQRLKPAA